MIHYFKEVNYWSNEFKIHQTTNTRAHPWIKILHDLLTVNNFSTETKTCKSKKFYLSPNMKEECTMA